MKGKRLLSSVLLVGLLFALAGGTELGLAQGPSPQATVGTAFTYQGRLNDGGSPANGEYDLRFMLYNAASSGTQVGSMVAKENTAVTDGLFTVQLDFGSDIFTGEARYLEIGVRPGASGANFTTLSPRQALTPAPYALSLGPGAKVVGQQVGGDVVRVENTASSGTGLVGAATSTSGSNFGLRGLTDSSSGIGVFGWAGASSGTTYGVKGYSKSGHGVYGETLGDWSNYSGVYGKSFYDHANGVNGENTAGGYGVRGESNTGVGVAAKSATGNIIEAWDTAPSSNRRWYVNNAGHVYADGTFHSGGADVAEMLPAADGLEPGDVLVIGSDGQLHHSSSPYDASVVGVYSTNPGFIGGSDEELENSGKVPLAIVGIVPVKASAENGPIGPGDLLTTSSTPGHAMRSGRFVGGSIIGKALEPLGEGTGVIKMLVTLQ